MDSEPDRDLDRDYADLDEAVAGQAAPTDDAFRSACIAEEDKTGDTPELLPERLARAAATVLGADGAGLSMLGANFRVPLGASNELATTAERLQFTQGAGPCLDAARQQRILVIQLDVMEARWPSFADELMRRTPYQAIMTLPLNISRDVSGAVDVYFVDPAHLQRVHLADAISVSAQIVQALRDGQGTTHRSEWTGRQQPMWMQGRATHDRTRVWIAIGIVMANLNLTADDALSLLRAHAYSHDTDVDTTAEAVIGGRLDTAELGDSVV